MIGSSLVTGWICVQTLDLGFSSYVSLRRSVPFQSSPRQGSYILRVSQAQATAIYSIFPRTLLATCWVCAVHAGPGKPTEEPSRFSWLVASWRPSSPPRSPPPLRRHWRRTERWTKAPGGSNPLGTHGNLRDKDGTTKTRKGIFAMDVQTVVTPRLAAFQGRRKQPGTGKPF